MAEFNIKNSRINQLSESGTNVQISGSGAKPMNTPDHPAEPEKDVPSAPVPYSESKLGSANANIGLQGGVAAGSQSSRSDSQVGIRKRKVTTVKHGIRGHTKEELEEEGNFTASSDIRKHHHVALTLAVSVALVITSGGIFWLFNHGPNDSVKPTPSTTSSSAPVVQKDVPPQAALKPKVSAEPATVPPSQTPVVPPTKVIVKVRSDGELAAGLWVDRGAKTRAEIPTGVSLRGVWVFSSAWLLGAETLGSDNSTQHFGLPGRAGEFYIPLAADEVILGMSGWKHAEIDSINIITNKKTYGPFPPIDGDTVHDRQSTEFEVMVPANHRVVGFYGSYMNVTNSIGFILEHDEERVQSSP